MALENQHGFLVHHKFLLVKFNQKYLKILRFIDRAVVVRKRSLRFICRHITYHSLNAFLRDFLHKGRDEVDELDVVIIDKYLINIFHFDWI
jgi:hypothetical protein